MTNDQQQRHRLKLRHLGDIITQLLGDELEGTVTVTGYENGTIHLHAVAAGDQVLITSRTTALIRQLKQLGLDPLVNIRLDRPSPPSATYYRGPGLGGMLGPGGKVHTNRKKGEKNKSDKDGGKKTVSMQELLEQAGKRERLTAVVRGLLDERVSAHITGVNYRADGELVVLCESPAWATQLRFLQRSLVPALAGKGMQIRKVTVGVTPEREELPRKQPDPIVPMSEETARAIEDTAEHISGDDLAEALRRLAKRGRRED